MKRGLMLGSAAVCVFLIAALVMLKVMPGPLKEFDYMVIGSVSTIAALGVVFVVLISSTKSSDVFFKKRRK